MPLLLFFIRNKGKQLLIRIKSPNYWKMKNKTTAFLSSATFLLFSLFCMCVAVRDARSFGYHIRWQYHWFILLSWQLITWFMNGSECPVDWSEELVNILHTALTIAIVDIDADQRMATLHGKRSLNNIMTHSLSIISQFTTLKYYEFISIVPCFGIYIIVFICYCW